MALLDSEGLIVTVGCVSDAPYKKFKRLERLFIVSIKKSGAKAPARKSIFKLTHYELLPMLSGFSIAF
jgi:hypothetical protein